MSLRHPASHVSNTSSHDTYDIWIQPSLVERVQCELERDLSRSRPIYEQVYMYKFTYTSIGKRSARLDRTQPLAFRKRQQYCAASAFTAWTFGLRQNSYNSSRFRRSRVWDTCNDLTTHQLVTLIALVTQYTAAHISTGECDTKVYLIFKKMYFGAKQPIGRCIFEQRSPLSGIIGPDLLERWGAGVETQKNVRGVFGGWGRVPFNEPYAPLLSTIYDGA